MKQVKLSMDKSLLAIYLSLGKYKLLLFPHPSNGAISLLICIHHWIKVIVDPDQLISSEDQMPADLDCYCLDRGNILVKLC